MHIDETEVSFQGCSRFIQEKTAQAINALSNGWYKINIKAVRRHLLMVGIDTSRITILYL